MYMSYNQPGMSTTHMDLPITAGIGKSEMDPSGLKGTSLIIKKLFKKN